MISNKNTGYVINKLKILHWYFIFICVLALLPSLFVDKHFAKGSLHFFFIALLPIAVYFNNSKRCSVYTKSEKIWLSLILIYVFYLYISGYYGQFLYDPLESRFFVTTDLLIKFLFPLILIPALYYIKFDYKTFLSIIFISALATTLVLAYDLGSGNIRGSRLSGAPIIYGNLSMLIGVLAVSIVIFSNEKLDFFYKLALTIVGFLAIIASLYSGSRGGWLLLLTVPFVFYVYISDKNFRKWVLVSYLIVLLLFIIGIYLEPTLQYRILDGYHEIAKISLAPFEYHAGSIGNRWEMWKASILIFLENPLFGVGLGNFYAAKLEFINQGLVNEGIIRYKHAHSMFATVLVSTGIIGIILITFIFAWLFNLYRKAAANSGTESIVGKMGIITLLAYIDFGLSESFIFTHLGAGAFFFLNSLYIYLIVNSSVEQEAVM